MKKTPEFIFSIIGCIFSIISLIISGYALNINQRNFFYENKPYLIITPIPFENNNYTLLTEEDNKKIIKTKFQIVNTGKTSAINVILPKGDYGYIVWTDKKTGKIASRLKVNQDVRQSVTIFPEEALTFTRKQDLNKEYTEGKTISTKIEIKYKNEINPSTEYTKIQVFEFTKASYEIQESSLIEKNI